MCRRRNVSVRLGRCGFATETNTESFVLELELSQSVLAQQADQLAQLFHVHGRCRLWSPCPPIWSVVLFFRFRHLVSRKDAKAQRTSFAPLRLSGRLSYSTSASGWASGFASVLRPAFFFLDADFARFFAASAASTSRGLSTSSMMASSARSPSRWPSFKIRV